MFFFSRILKKDRHPGKLHCTFFTRIVSKVIFIVNCKTVRIFAYSSTREQSNKRSGTRLKTESETGERLLGHALPISSMILRKKTRLFCSLFLLKEVKPSPEHK